MKSGLEIAQEAVLRPITDVAADAGILEDELEQYGRFKGKISLSILERLADRPDGKLVITTAITPTKAGEGKTTTSISLAQGMGTDRQGRDALPPRALDGPGLRDQGRRQRRRLRPGRPDGGDQPPFQRRLPRRAGRAQPPRGRPGRVDLPRQPARHRPGVRDLAEDPRRERSRAPLRRRRARGEGARRPAREPVRDRGGLGDHGRARALERPRRPPRAARPRRRRIHLRRHPGHRRRPPGRRARWRWS